jgi:hypothetical protein
MSYRSSPDTVEQDPNVMLIAPAYFSEKLVNNIEGGLISLEATSRENSL